MQSQEEALVKNSKEKFLLESSECGTNFFGPALPPHFIKENSSKHSKRETCGPTVSYKFGEKGKETSVPEQVKVLIGPELPESLKLDKSLLEVDEKPITPSDDEEDNYGPSATLMLAESISAYKFRNSQDFTKLNSENTKESSVKRETWMTELPEKKRANLGLYPRHFKARIQTDKESDDSVWTDTPADKKKKECQNKTQDHEEILKMKRLKERDKEMEKLVKKAAKKLKKKQSLLEMHLENKKKLEKEEKKKRKKEGKIVPERRPFDRNVDLQIRKFDENQKRAIISKSQFLNDRFAPGQSKFL